MLSACRQLSALDIHTIATTLFTFEQAVLAAECGCTYIAPFVHELKAFFDESYHDGGANLVLCHEIQQYYQKHQYPTKVKAAGLLSLDEAKALAGVATMTVAPDLLRTLATTRIDEKDVCELSLFRDDNKIEEKKLERKSYVYDEEGWRQAYAEAYDGKGQWKTVEAIGIFQEYQLKAERLIQETEQGSRDAN
ncbi:MAG: hypothetical protein Q9195_008716 [Heterodermia aff. obscurata]